MGWNVIFLLHLFCAMAAMAGVHSQGNANQEDLIHNRAFEGEAVHSMMRSWLNAGTSPYLFNSRWHWYIDEHPCYENLTRANYMRDWYGIYCFTKSYQPEGSNLYHNLVQINLNINDYDSMRLLGELPPAVTNLTNLEYLSIENARKLSGPLPAGLFCVSSVLQSITLVNCSFNGSISSGFGPSCGNNYGLEYLDLSGNSFTEMNPISSNVDTLKYFTNLTYLNVSNNQIKGEFVTWANSLKIVDISNNFILNITALGINSELRHSLKSIYAQNNSISVFPINFFEYETLQDINLDFNNISSIVPNFSNINVSTLQRISMSKNKLQSFPEGLLQLPNLEEINPTSTFSEPSILLDTKVFLYGNPICKYRSHKAKLLRSVCRINAAFPIEDEEFNNVKKSYKILLIVVACVSIVVAVLFIMGFSMIRKLKKKVSLLNEIQSEFQKRDVKPNLYSYSELKVATQDFHIRNELGRGGFGIVYKGILPDGSHVAVKKLTKLSMKQGIQDFLSEIIVVSNIKHRNLVQLKGCCIRENQRILVHEFVENNNLKDSLWRDSKSNMHLNWPTRFNIILGIARGLTYLHEDVQPAIVHRDIKGENILLDKHYNPKIADFGLALFFPSFDDGETHMSVSKVAGTRGYMAPEYFCYGQVSTKIDVFSFGVLLLEIVSGRKIFDLKLPSTEQYLVQWAQELHSNDNLPNLKDKSLEEMTMVEKATFKQVVKVGLQCLHHIAARRPTMSEVVAMLIGNKNVDNCALEDYYEGSSTSYDMGSSSLCFPTPNSSLQCIGEHDDSLHLDYKSHKHSLQLCEIGLLSK